MSEMVVQIADLKAEVSNLNRRLDEARQTIKDYEEGLPVYCKTCGSCGESGCCSPSNCVAVQCLYGEHNLVEYKDLLDENERLRTGIEKAWMAGRYGLASRFEYYLHELNAKNQET